jgi:anaerobic selenocysteine-containing dehydrogenase
MSEIDRRNFLKLVGVSAGASAAVGCSDLPEKLIPYVVQPEEIIPGVAVIYASTCQECSAGCGLHVRTREARPIKLEGNPDHPVNKGSLCPRGQAGIDRTYHPGRYQSPMLRGADGVLAPITWDEATNLLAQKLKASGAKTQILGGLTGPTLGGLLADWASAVGASANLHYEPFGNEALREATRRVFGVAQRPTFHLADSDFIIDFGSDFLETGPRTRLTRELAASRDILSHPDGERILAGFNALEETV